MARKTGSHAAQTGPKVQGAALKLFAQHGYAAVSMRQIAAEVGVSQMHVSRLLRQSMTMMRAAAERSGADGP